MAEVVDRRACQADGLGGLGPVGPQPEGARSFVRHLMRAGADIALTSLRSRSSIRMARQTRTIRSGRIARRRLRRICAPVQGLPRVDRGAPYAAIGGNPQTRVARVRGASSARLVRATIAPMAARSDQSWHRLQNWTAGSTSAERMSLQVLLGDGYTRGDPSHPLGGPDGGADALVEREGVLWVMAAYFPHRQRPFPRQCGSLSPTQRVP